MIAITDHNNFEGALEAKKLAKELKSQVRIILGEEIRTKEGEVIGLFMNELIPKKLSLDETLDLLRSQDAIISAPHPFDSLRHHLPMDSLAKSQLSKIHAIEVLNARVTFIDDNLKAMEFASNHKKAKVGGSDAHMAFEIGTALTEFEGETAEDLRKAITKGKTKAIGKLSSPLVHLGSTFAKVAHKFR
jgi:predicted metal-dependent phosphoesterase TrpH